MGWAEQKIRELLDDSSNEKFSIIQDCFIDLGDEKSIAELISISIQGSKKKLWVSVSQLLLHWKSNDEVINYFLDSLADKNWPGYSIN